MRFTVDRLDHLVVTTKDVEISAAWYQRVLGMEREDYSSENRCALKFGGQKLNLRPADSLSWPSGKDAAPGTQDLCFITAVGPEDVIGHLHGSGVMIEAGPVKRIGALGEITSVYCRDPDGNLIELASYLD